MSEKNTSVKIERRGYQPKKLDEGYQPSAQVPVMKPPQVRTTTVVATNAFASKGEASKTPADNKSKLAKESRNRT